MKKSFLIIAILLYLISSKCYSGDKIRYQLNSLDSTYYVTYMAYQNPNKNYKNIDSTIYIADSIEFSGKKYPVTGIGAYAFMHAGKLDTVYLPNTIKFINSWAFSNTGIRYIVFGDSLESIGQKAFADPCSVTELRLPASLKSISTNAFQYPYHLKDVYCEGLTPPSLGYYVFYLSGDMEAQLHNINLHVPQGATSAYKNAGHWGYFNIIEDSEIPTSVNLTKKGNESNIAIENGHLYIIKDGIKYNLLGNRIH